MVQSLNTLLPGDRGVILEIRKDAGAIRHRLMEIGLTVGAQLEFLRHAPLGDPIEIRIGDTRLSLRQAEAATVIIRRTG